MNKKVMAIVLVLVIGVAGYFIYDAKFSNKNASQPSELRIEDVYYYSTGDYFVTNIKDSKSLSKVSVSLALTGKDQTEMLTTNNALIRSVIVDVMRNHTEEELRAVDATAMLSGEMLVKLKEALKLKDIVNVCISDFVVQ